MEFSNELKNKFIDLVESRNIIVVSRQYGKDYTKFEHKVIGVQNGLSWDFTPMIASLTECRTNGKSIESVAVRGFANELLSETLKLLRTTDFRVPENIIMNVRDFYKQHFM
jgi:hypothetical protein